MEPVCSLFKSLGTGSYFFSWTVMENFIEGLYKNFSI